ncbi:MAG: hypothetical protein DME09_17505 [Candidatus Rokuibacteriota bacterium]|nr:MAG: hypothetical protein DME09_17505 [Candidatus Rokubacteria bacterium]
MLEPQLPVRYEWLVRERDHGKLALEPFDPRFALTVGNAYRRVLLSSIHGSAPTWVKIENVLHEFSYLPGVTEDTHAESPGGCVLAPPEPAEDPLAQGAGGGDGQGQRFRARRGRGDPHARPATRDPRQGPAPSRWRSAWSAGAGTYRPRSASPRPCRQRAAAGRQLQPDQAGELHGRDAPRQGQGGAPAPRGLDETGARAPSWRWRRRRGSSRTTSTSS